MSVNAEAGNGVVIERYSLNCKIGSLGVGCREDVRGEYIATGGDTLLDTATGGDALLDTETCGDTLLDTETGGDTQLDTETGGDTLLDTETAVWCAAFEDGCFGEDVSDCVLVSCT